MKKALVTLTVIAVLGFGAFAFAHTPGGGYGNMGYGYGHMMSPGGYGYGMMGPGGYGHGPMMGYGWGTEDKKFLEETADLRRTIHEKRFEYMEAVRTGDEEKAEALDKEIDTLFEKLSKSAPDDRFDRKGNGFRGRGFARGGYGPCWQ